MLYRFSPVVFSRRASRTPGRFPALATLALALASMPQARAATHVWTGTGGNALWSNAANWTNGKPASNETNGTVVQFGTNTVTTCDIVDLVVDSVTFTGGGNIITGTTPLKIKGDVVTTNVSSTGTGNTFGTSLPLVFGSAQLFIEVPSGTLTIAGNCSGNIGFRKKGAGTLTLAGVNTYTSSTDIAAGTLVLNSDASNTALPPSQPVVVGLGTGPAGSAVLSLAQGLEIPDTVLVAVGSDGIFQTNNFSEAIGSLLIQSGTVNLGSSAFTVKGTTTMTGGSILGGAAAMMEQVGTLTAVSSASTGGAVISAQLLFHNNLTVLVNSGPAQPDLTLSGVMRGLDLLSGVVKNGPGTLLMTADNVYPGTTQINAGTLLANGAQGSSAVNVLAGASVGGTGVLGNLATQNSTTALVAPGPTATPGILRVNGSATLAGATLEIRLNDAAAQKNDALKVSGSLDLTGATLAPLPVGVFSPGPYIIATYGDFGGTLTGTFAHVPSGYSVNYAYNDGTSSRNVALTVTNPFFVWAANYGLDPATTAQAGADPDHDGVPNALEFVFGTSPVNPNTTPIVPRASVAGTDFVFTYRLSRSGLYLHPVVEVSTTLAPGSWTPVTTGISTAANFYGSGVDQLTVTVPMNGRKQLFARLSIDTP